MIGPWLDATNCAFLTQRNVMSLREARHLHGHGSLIGGSGVVLPHVGYSIVEHRQDGVVTGYVRGDANALKGFGSARHELVLVLDDGMHLRIVLTGRTDDLTWEFRGISRPHR